MKKVLFSLVILFTFSASAQQSELKAWKYRIKQVEIRLLDTQNEWGSWTKPNRNEMDDALTVLDLIHKKLSIYGPTQRDYSLIKVDPDTEDKDGHYFSFHGVDYKNEKCSFLLSFSKNDTRKPLLFILYPKAEIALTLETEDY